jgi:DNA-binding transcriptional ArsR family regulator
MRTVSVVSASADTFRAISDPTRRAILDRLSAGEAAAGQLGDAFEMSQPAVSQHLRILRDAGLVRQRRVGRRRLYRIEPQPLREVYDWVIHYERFWAARLDALGALLDRQSKEPTTTTKE